MIQLAAGDTWGIPSQDFLVAYLFMGLTAAVIAATTYLLTVKTWTPTDLSGLSPTELGMLVHDRRAILAAVTTLRVGRLIDDKGVRRAADGQALVRLDPLTLAVYDKCREPGPRLVSRLTIDSKHDLDELRQRLIDNGLLFGPQTRARLSCGSAPLLAVILVGLVRIVAGVVNAKPVGGLVVLICLFGIVAFVCLGVPRRTAVGTDALIEATQQSTHLDPSKKPAYTTYGAIHAGIAAALFGGATLWVLDPKLAAAASIPQYPDQSNSAGGGWSGGGCGGGGGGGCGGGGGGCGG